MLFSQGTTLMQWQHSRGCIIYNCEQTDERLLKHLAKLASKYQVSENYNVRTRDFNFFEDENLKRLFLSRI